jgi:hypothetical protein
MSVEGVVSLPHDGLSVRRLVNDDRSSDPPRDGASHIFRYYQVKMDGERVCSYILKPLILIHEQLREKDCDSDVGGVRSLAQPGRQVGLMTGFKLGINTPAKSRSKGKRCTSIRQR